MIHFAECVEDLVASDIGAADSLTFYIKHLSTAFLMSTVYRGLGGGGDKTLERYWIHNCGRSEDRVYMDYTSITGSTVCFQLNVQALLGMSIDDLRELDATDTIPLLTKLANTVNSGLLGVPPMSSLLHKTFYIGRDK